MKTLHLNCGTMCPFPAQLWNGTGGYFKSGELVCHCLLIESSDGLILVDTGFGRQDVSHPAQRIGRKLLLAARPKLDEKEPAAVQLARLGYEPKDVRHIMVTHLDAEHAGGLADFPDATVHILKSERESVAPPIRGFYKTFRYRPIQWGHQPKWKLHEEGGETWEGFSSVRALGGTNDEVLYIPLAGHTPGHCGVAVKQANGWLLHAGDSYFFHGQMQEEPWVPAGTGMLQRMFDSEPVKRLENQERLRQLVLGHPEIKVFCSHDPHDFYALSRGDGSAKEC